MSLRRERVGALTDLDHGQIVIVTARWILIAVGLFLLIVKPTGNVGELRLQVALILLLGMANFFLHAQLLKRRPIPEAVVYVASAVDLTVISILLLSQGGDSPLYVLYFPALLALSVAFDPVVTSFYAIATAAVYGSAAVMQAPAGVDVLPVVTTRLLMLVAVACCGGFYWYVERDRRRRAVRPHRVQAPDAASVEGSL